MAAAAMRTAFTRLGFTADAAATIVGDQGIDTVNEIGFLVDDNRVELLCKAVRRPGGQVANNAADIANGGPAMIASPGFAISAKAEWNLKLAAYYVRHRGKVSRTIAPNDIDADPVRALRDLMDWETNHVNPEVPEDLVNPKDWTKTLEGLQEILRDTLGVTKIPLAYVIRSNEPASDDPDGGWTSIQDEMIGRAPILGNAAGDPRNPTFMSDNTTVWNLIQGIFRNKDAWTYIKPFSRTRDGRQAYKALYDHYLGPNAVNNAASQAERKLTGTTYDGEKKRWSWEKYVQVHAEQHSILASLEEHGYRGIDDRSKVRFLMDGIKTTTLDSVKTRIMSEPTLSTDFDKCCGLYKDFIEQMGNQSHKSLNVSELETTGTHRSKKGSNPKKRSGGGGGVEERYYSAKEYATLSSEDKLKLKQMREARGHVPKAKKAKTYSKNDVRQVAQLVREQLNLEGDNDDDQSTASDGTEAVTNANHPATNRNGRGSRAGRR